MKGSAGRGSAGNVVSRGDRRRNVIDGRGVPARHKKEN
jgi:hypothetical protein